MICIQICSNSEWRALREILKVKDEKVCSTPYGEYIVQSIVGKECIFYHSGVTKTKSSGACQYAISKWSPYFLFVLGTCGGVSESLNPLDIVIANKTVQYDCIIGMDEKSDFFYDALSVDIDNSWIDFDNIEFSLYEGIIATADQDLECRQLEKLRRENVLCADWESGAISHICKLNGVNCCVLRGITDIPLKNDFNSAKKQAVDYRTNTPLVMEKLINTVLPELLNQVYNQNANGKR